MTVCERKNNSENTRRSNSLGKRDNIVSKQNRERFFFSERRHFSERETLERGWISEDRTSGQTREKKQGKFGSCCVRINKRARILVRVYAGFSAEESTTLHHPPSTTGFKRKQHTQQPHSKATLARRVRELLWRIGGPDGLFVRKGTYREIELRLPVGANQPTFRNHSLSFHQ